MSVHPSIPSLTHGVVPQVKKRPRQEDAARLSRFRAAAVMGMGLAHQMSQPLSAVATYIHAARRLLNATPVDHDNLVETMEKAENELKRTRDILEHLRRLMSGESAERLPVDLLEITDRVVRILQQEADARAVRIVIAPGSLPSLMADAVQIKQVLLNLINNAIDAAAETSDGLVSIRCCHDGSTIEIEVADNGRGIESDMADKVFEPFQTTKLHGMGLGLPLSRQILEAHGGVIWWEREVPQGTTFHLRLPVDGCNSHET